MRYQENTSQNTKINGVDKYTFYNYDYDEVSASLELFFDEWSTIVLKIFPLPIPALSCHQQHLYTFP